MLRKIDGSMQSHTAIKRTCDSKHHEKPMPKKNHHDADKTASYLSTAGPKPFIFQLRDCIFYNHKIKQDKQRYPGDDTT